MSGETPRRTFDPGSGVLDFVRYLGVHNCCSRKNQLLHVFQHEFNGRLDRQTNEKTH